jgi:hypothetical protein
MIPNPFDSGKLDKMYVQAFNPVKKQDEVPTLSKDEKDKYEVQVNPESISVGLRVRYDYNYVQGNSGYEKKYAGTESGGLSVELLFDSTGAIPPKPGPLANVPIVGAVAGLFSDEEEFDVMNEIRKFLHVVYNYKGDAHRPRQIRIYYGKLAMDAVATNIDIDYKLFTPQGIPIRAVVRCQFEETISDLLRENKEKNNSPDLTHIRSVVEGDTLPLMTDKIYRDPAQYIEVARVNKLFNFRSLRAGQQLMFPPIDKSSA